uniref:Uncharacterized protein n=1 Tax=Anguilla anguilla TaxID=7936 RepID=A0A0E9Q781_ANGAN
MSSCNLKHFWRSFQEAGAENSLRTFGTVNETQSGERKQ